MATTFEQPPAAQPGPSRSATVADESEELAAEAGTTVEPSTSTDGTNGTEDAGKVEDEKVEEEVKEEDPNRIPDNACETLYIQNLNEKVLLPGKSHSHNPHLTILYGTGVGSGVWKELADVNSHR